MKKIWQTGPAGSAKWQWFLALGLGALAVVIWGLLSRSPEPPARPEPVAEHKPRMEGLSLTEIQEGDKRWVLSARKADFHQDQMEISISGVGVEFFGPGEHIRVKADEGVFHTKTRVLTLSGQVEMQRGDLLIQARVATYLPKERVLLAPDEVTLSEPALRVQGKNLRVELAQKRLVLAQHEFTEMKLKDWRPKR